MRKEKGKRTTKTTEDNLKKAGLGFAFLGVLCFLLLATGLLENGYTAMGFVIGLVGSIAAFTLRADQSRSKRKGKG